MKQKLFLSLDGLKQAINQDEISLEELDISLFFFDREQTPDYLQPERLLPFDLKFKFPADPDISTRTRQILYETITKAAREQRIVTYPPSGLTATFLRLNKFLESNGLRLKKTKKYELVLKGWLMPSLEKIIDSAELELEVIF